MPTTTKKIDRSHYAALNPEPAVVSYLWDLPHLLGDAIAYVGRAAVRGRAESLLEDRDKAIEDLHKAARSCLIHAAILAVQPFDHEEPTTACEAAVELGNVAANHADVGFAGNLRHTLNNFGVTDPFAEDESDDE